jgi:hypothetical protein
MEFESRANTKFHGCNFTLKDTVLGSAERRGRPARSRRCRDTATEPSGTSFKQVCRSQFAEGNSCPKVYPVNPEYNLEFEDILSALRCAGAGC